MSNSIFPALPGLAWSVVKTPRWNTTIQQSVGGKETRYQFFSAPLWRWTLAYEVLRAASAFQELQQLVGFYNARQGAFDSFLYSDPTDNAVTGQSFGTGDGATTQFQLVRDYGAAGFTGRENVYDLAGVPSIFRADWQGTQLLYSTARTNLLFPSEPTAAQLAVSSGVTTTAAPATTWAGDLANGINFTAASGVSKWAYLSYAVTIGQPYTLSLFVRMADNSAPRPGSSVSTTADFALRIGGTDVNATVTPTAVAGIYRVSGTYTPSGAGSNCGVVQYNTQTGAKGFDVVGWQLETGATMTAYMKSTGAPVTVTDYTLNGAGLVTLAVAPLAAAALTWTGGYYWRVRFEQDTQDFENFLNQLWLAKSVALVTVK